MLRKEKDLITPMFLNGIGCYIPKQRLTNAEIVKLNGMDPDTIVRKTGILQRSIAGPRENATTMAIQAVKNLLKKAPDALKGVDLIIGGSYTPYDVVGTMAHVVQAEFDLDDARAVFVSSACSSFINALEIVEGYFATGKSQKALVLVSEHNSKYNDPANKVSGHLWGDGAAAVIVTKSPSSTNTFEIHDLMSKGLGHIGKGPKAVYNRVADDGLIMPDGRNVFLNACTYMVNDSLEILEKNKLTTKDLNYFIAHQANTRIIDHVQEKLGVSDEICLTNIEDLGNTGCASTVLVLDHNFEKYQSGDTLLISVFGGGFSSGNVLMKRV